MHIQSALDISKYIINKHIELGKPVSNLKLQKILYYIQGEILAKLNRQAFNEAIFAWKHGPVLLEVYYKYSNYIANIRKVA